MSLQIENIKVFLAAAEEGSFSAAARKLGKAQSSVSALIQNLEIDLGLTLFDRSGRNPVLSEEGAAILQEAKSVLHSLESLEVKSQGLNTGVESQLSLAVDEAAIASEKLTPIIAEFRERFPTINLVILSPAHNGPAKLVENDQADLAIMRSLEDYPEDFHFRGIGSTSFITVCAQQHPLASVENVSESDLAKHCHLRITTADLGCRKDDSEISFQRIYADSYQQLIQLVMSGLGWAQIPMHLLTHHLEQKTIIRINSSYQTVPYVCPTDLIWHRNKRLGSGGQWLRDKLSSTQ